MIWQVQTPTPTVYIIGMPKKPSVLTVSKCGGGVVSYIAISTVQVVVTTSIWLHTVSCTRQVKHLIISGASRDVCVVSGADQWMGLQVGRGGASAIGHSPEET